MRKTLGGICADARNRHLLDTAVGGSMEGGYGQVVVAPPLSESNPQLTSQSDPIDNRKNARILADTNKVPKP